MARCPKCKENWFWDWEQDVYRYVDGSEVEILNFDKAKSDEPKIEICVFKCKCGAINSVMFLDPNSGMFVRCIKIWDNIDWEEDGNCWDDCYLIPTEKKILVIAERGNCSYLTEPQIKNKARNWSWNKALKSRWSGGTLNKLNNIITLPFNVINMLPPNDICGSWDKDLAKSIKQQIENYLELQTEYCAVILLGRRVADTLFSKIEFGDIKKIGRTKILCANHTASRTSFWSKNNSTTKELLLKLIN